MKYTLKELRDQRDRLLKDMAWVKSQNEKYNRKKNIEPDSDSDNTAIMGAVVSSAISTINNL